MRNRHLLRCDWCGRFTKLEDYAVYELLDYWREHVVYVSVCRKCDPSKFEKERDDDE